MSSSLTLPLHQKYKFVWQVANSIASMPSDLVGVGNEDGCQKWDRRGCQDANSEHWQELREALVSLNNLLWLDCPHVALAVLVHGSAEAPRFWRRRGGPTISHHLR